MPPVLDDIHVIVYLRRQDEYISSQWKQSVKGGFTDHGFDAYLRLPVWSFRMDYAARIRCIEEAPGPRGRVTVRRYVKEGFTGGGIFHDFCEAAGISWDDAFVVPKKAANLSISNDVAVALLPFKEAASHESELSTRTGMYGCPTRDASKHIGGTLPDGRPNTKD